ncbi:MAG: hypothetical protein FJ280_20340 [Planctomycetes bacterium]|nr:hypothetical protein [Planctomycetota bacterium]
MRQVKNIEEQIQDLRQTADAGMHDRILGHLQNVLRQRQTRPTVVQPAIRALLGEHPVTKLAALVAILAALAVFGTSLSPSRSVYAGVVKALQQVNAVHISGWTTQVSPTHTVIGDEPYPSQRYEVEIWEWFTAQGEYRLYDRQGPILLWDNGNRRHEYHADKDRLYVSTARNGGRPYAARFRSMTENLESLQKRGIRITDLGVRAIEGRPAKGLKTERGDRHYDLWIDTETNLPLEANAWSFRDGQWRQDMHRAIRYDPAIPASIASYLPPAAKDVHYSSDIDPRYEKWNQRLLRIAAYYAEHPLPEGMDLLPCDSNDGPLARCYAPGRLPGITERTGHWVMPLRWTLGAFLQNEFRPAGLLRVPEDIAAMPLNHDLIIKNEHTARARIEFVLGRLGLELVETAEPRNVWIAHYDGRPLKPWRQVKAPIPNPNHAPLRPGMAVSTSCPTTIRELFEGFVFYQNQSLTADQILIVDETGLPSEPAGPPDYRGAAASEQPYWGGKESIEIAKRWFQEQFGITFTEETRPGTVHIVRRHR